MKHTPGPWHVSKLFFWQIDRMPDEGRIGPNYNYIAETPRTEAGRVNAHLIAAAPDLLAACEKALANLQGQHLGTKIGLQAIEQMQAAIAKAEIQ